ncbi:FKBP-type peptidyl-prolyl cis-trans isomerase [Desulfoluna spongiiphila]|uniref:FKBP-type peptidyl-prolyl cis-trans isomerase n=1 Tax=Desulfoluna spongiiphila TaxID=419481 RepID=UPI0012525DFA|nr:FKBP-type peptidyl-prolyl cis-trans isomerase [Desulfoluna spongiiphila]VVS94342.1 peptidyl-prolyl cis-trans isomerase fkbp-type n-terminal [Desulfoluna spongiiphila]
MKKSLISASLALLITLTMVTVTLAEEAKEGALKSFDEQIGYTIGMEIGTNLKSNALELDLDALIKGIQDGFHGNEQLMTSEEMMATKTKAIEKMQAKRIKMTVDNLEKANAFLAENKTKKGITTTESGLQYEVITKGKGDTPKASDKVKVHYRGMLLDGTVFDSSYKRNEPATFQVDRLIKGWTEALQIMTTGSKWKLYVPPALAYGANGNGPKIGPNEALIFEMELLEIVPSAE